MSESNRVPPQGIPRRALHGIPHPRDEAQPELPTTVREDAREARERTERSSPGDHQQRPAAPAAAEGDQRGARAQDRPDPPVPQGPPPTVVSDIPRPKGGGNAAAEADYSLAQPERELEMVQRYGSVAGWLVVTEGPGRGISKPFFFGRNTIGRDVSQRIALAYGDREISRIGHAFLVFERHTNVGFLEDGRQENLVRVNGKVVRGSVDLNVWDRISIGSTSMMYVPLCGLDWDWDRDNAKM